MNVRLLGADQAPLLARAYYAEGDPGPIVAALAQVPELLEVVMPFLGTAFGPTAIPWRTKEIVILRTSSQLDCRYCIQSHTTVALDAGLRSRRCGRCVLQCFPTASSPNLASGL